MNPQQLADSVIADENLSDANSSTEEVVTDGANDDTGADNTQDNDASDAGTSDDTNKSTDTDESDENKDASTEDGNKSEVLDTKGESSKTDEPAPKLDEPILEPEGKTATETVEEGRSILETLELTQDKVFNQDGTAKPFNEVIQPGPYLASQLEPVKVTDKDGKVHEFLLLSDVEKQFPDGFEAKNNIEQMKFERAILGNETKFDEAVKTYKNAEVAYTQETNAIIQANSDNARLRNEYNSMATQGLVPKVEGDPNDPKFLEQPAVKELDKILNWQTEKNKELASKGLGQINSLYVAKQLMDSEGVKIDKSKDKEAIINERKEVASLTNSSQPAGDKSKPNISSNIPMSRFADEIIAQEGLK